MLRQRTQRQTSPVNGPTTMFLCINGSDESLQRALDGAAIRGAAGVVLALARGIAEERRPWITRVVIRWKRGSEVLAHLSAAVAEIVDAESTRGAFLLGDSDPNARPWPSLRTQSRGCVIRLTELSRVESEMEWTRVPSPQSWTYLKWPSP